MILKQFSIILTAMFAGFLLTNSTGIPIPANIMGFVILFLALFSGIVKIEQIDKVSGFIIEYLALFFVVSIVGIMVYFDMIADQFVKIFVPLIVSILLGFFTAGKVTELCLSMAENRIKKTVKRK